MIKKLKKASQSNRVDTLVSVIIPTYNRERTIERAIRSALNQSISVEVLVCDDGSTDNTSQIIKSIGDSRVRFIKCVHSGRPAIPRNKGIKEARGEWIAFLDSDDEWLPDKLEKQFLVIKKSKVKAVASNAYKRMPNGGIVGNFLFYDKKYIDFNYLLYSNPIICSSMMIHKSLINLVGIFPEDEKLTAVEDYAFWLKIATQTKIAYIKDPLLIYNDDLKVSIRKKDINNTLILFKQRELVFKNLLMWSKKHKMPKKTLGLLSLHYLSSCKGEIFRKKTLKKQFLELLGF